MNIDNFFIDNFAREQLGEIGRRDEFKHIGSDWREFLGIIEQNKDEQWVKINLGCFIFRGYLKTVVWGTDGQNSGRLFFSAVRTTLDAISGSGNFMENDDYQKNLNNINKLHNTITELNSQIADKVQHKIDYSPGGLRCAGIGEYPAPMSKEEALKEVQKSNAELFRKKKETEQKLKLLKGKIKEHEKQMEENGGASLKSAPEDFLNNIKRLGVLNVDRNNAIEYGIMKDFCRAGRYKGSCKVGAGSGISWKVDSCGTSLMGDKKFLSQDPYFSLNNKLLKRYPTF